jgi:hypothetical protein
MFWLSINGVRYETEIHYIILHRVRKASQPEPEGRDRSKMNGRKQPSATAPYDSRLGFYLASYRSATKNNNTNPGREDVWAYVSHVGCHALFRGNYPLPVRSFTSASCPTKEKYERVDKHCLCLSFTWKSKNRRRKPDDY